MDRLTFFRSQEAKKGRPLLEVEYFVNKKNKTVTCKPLSKLDELNFIRNEIATAIPEKNARYFACIILNNSILLNMIETKSPMGIARCMDEDEFNERIGREIAYRKLKDKLKRKAFRIVTKFTRPFDAAERNLYKKYTGDNQTILEDKYGRK